MIKPTDRFAERRRFIRLAQDALAIDYNASGSAEIHHAVAKNISADGLRFETTDRSISQRDTLELRIGIPGATNPVHTKSTVVWKKRLSLQDGAPFDVGLEFTEIEEDNKNTFLKYLCDLIYNLPEAIKNEDKKI